MKRVPTWEPWRVIVIGVSLVIGVITPWLCSSSVSAGESGWLVFPAWAGAGVFLVPAAAIGAIISAVAGWREAAGALAACCLIVAMVVLLAATF